MQLNFQKHKKWSFRSKILIFHETRTKSYGNTQWSCRGYKVWQVKMFGVFISNAQVREWSCGGGRAEGGRGGGINLIASLCTQST